MARPIKNNAEYFGHDADMRNNIKIKALRRKFGNGGYAIWCFILETLTDSANFCIEYTEINQELMAADFDINVEELQDIVAFCVRINLLKLSDDNFLYSEEHKSRFEQLIEKRERRSQINRQNGQKGGNPNFQKDKSNPYYQTTERITENITERITEDITEQITETLPKTEKEQKKISEDNSKVKESKGKESKVKDIIRVAKATMSTKVDDSVPQNDFNAENFKKFFNSEIKNGNSVIMQIRAVTGGRAMTLKARLREYGEAALKEAVMKAVKSDFLNGKNNKGFVASFDWIMRPNNFPKVLEGNYDNNKIPPHGANDMHRNGQILHTDNMDYTAGLW